jgi:uncharacterized protein
MFFMSPISLALLLPAILLSLWAQTKVKSAYAKYSKIASLRGYTGARAAQQILYAAGVNDVTIEAIEGKLSDHYDPRKRTLRLSHDVHEGRSLAALGIAAHEAGHALQHAFGYAPLSIRSAIVPLAGFGTNGAWFLFIIGLLFRSTMLMNLGIMFFACGVVFYIITLPVEFNASSRAIMLLESQGIIERSEVAGTRSVLSAAALTYVAAAAMAVMQLVRLLVLRGSRN